MRKIVFVLGIVHFFNNACSEGKSFQLSPGSAFKKDFSRDCRLSFFLPGLSSNCVDDDYNHHLEMLKDKEKKAENEKRKLERSYKLCLMTYSQETEVFVIYLDEDQKRHAWFRYRDILENN